MDIKNISYMKLIKTHQDYLEDLLIESISKNEFIFIISNELLNILYFIKHPISSELIKLTNYTLKNLKKQTYIDISYDEYDKWYFVNSSKLISELTKIDDIDKYQHPYDKMIDIIGKNNSIINKIKSKVKIGRLIKKLFGDKFPDSGSDDSIESFIDMYKRQFDIEGDFKLVEGDDIIKYYNLKKYYPSTNSNPLHNSCMSYDKCSDYLKFYSINPDKVKMLVLLDDNKVKGRSLIWNIDEINEKEVKNTYFMDRVYYIDNKTLNGFISYAIKNNFLYKKNQNSDVSAFIVNPITSSEDKLKIKVKNFNYHENLEFPFLDTLYKYNPYEKILTNDNKYNEEKNYVELESTIGQSNIIWSSYYNDILLKHINCKYSNLLYDFIHIDDVKLVKINKSIDYINKNNTDILKKYKYSKMYDGYYDYDKVTYLKRYDDYIPNDKLNSYNGWVWSEFFNEYLSSNDDAVYSVYMEDWIPIENSIKVFTDKDKQHYYITMLDDPSNNFYKHNGEYYSDDIKKEDLK